jgi:hypothetical protein
LRKFKEISLQQLFHFANATWQGKREREAQRRPEDQGRETIRVSEGACNDGACLSQHKVIEHPFLILSDCIFLFCSEFAQAVYLYVPLR